MEAMQTLLEPSLTLYCCMYSGCLNEYSTKFNLKRHVESVHLQLKHYSCTLCSSQFSSKQTLKEHLRIHSGIMPFKCTACLKSFRQASQLSLHRRIHILEGKDSEFVKMKLDETIMVEAVSVCLEVNKEKFQLPEISANRVGLFRLPFPK